MYGRRALPKLQQLNPAFNPLQETEEKDGLGSDWRLPHDYHDGSFF
jgi:hypothetical protein